MEPEGVVLTDTDRRLIEENVRLVYFVANRYRHIPAEAYQSLVSRLMYRLCVAVHEFKPELGYKISSFLVKSLWGEVRNFYRDEVWMVRPPRKLREKSLAEVIDRNGDACIADVQGESRDTVFSCLHPVPLNERDIPDRDYGDPTYNSLMDPFDLEQDVIERIGGGQIISALFAALSPEERTMLSLQMDGKGTAEIQLQFLVSRSVAQEMWDELQKKCQGLYALVHEGKELPRSEGSQALKRSVMEKFIPEKVNFLEVRKRIQERMALANG